MRSHVLTYQFRPRSRRLRIVLIIVALATTALIGRSWAARYVNQASYLFHQRRCCRWKMAPNEVVYEDDGAAAALLLKKEGYREPTMKQFAWPGNKPWPGWQSPAMRYSSSFDVIAPVSLAHGWSGLAYMRRLDDSNGEALVVVRLGCAEFRPDGYAICLAGSAYTLAAWKPGSRAAPPPPHAHTRIIRLGPADHLRLYAGQTNAADPRQFSIAYVWDGQTGRIDGGVLSAGAPRRDGKPPLNFPTVELWVASGPLEFE